MIVIGIDIAKKSFDATLIDESGQIIISSFLTPQRVRKQGIRLKN